MYRNGSLSQSVGLRTLWSLTSLGSRLSASLIVLFVQAKILGAASFGYLAFGLSCASLAALALDSGSILHALRTVAAHRPGVLRQARADYFLRLLILPVLCCISIVVILYSAPAGLVAAYGFLYAGVFLSVCTEYNAALMRALGRYSDEAFVAVINNAVFAAIAITAVILQHTVVASSLAMLLARAAGFVISALTLSRGIKVSVPHPSEGEKISPASNMHKILPYAKDVILSNGMNQIDLALAGALFASDKLGAYAVASRCFQVLNYFVGAMANVFIPTLASADPPRQREILGILNGITLIMGVAVFAMCWLGGHALSSALGNSYLLLDPEWPLVGVAATARIFASGTALGLTGIGLQPLRVRALMIGFPLLVLLSLGLGRWFGLSGYILAGAVTFATITLTQHILRLKAQLNT